MRLLVVEDEPKFGRLLLEGLKAEHFAVDLALDGETGLELATQSDYDAIILDLNLPRMDGFTVLQRIRKQRLQVPVLILSDHTETADRVRALNMGADDFLRKPFSFEELVASVHALLRRLRVQKELRRSRDELEFRMRERTAELHDLASSVVRLQDEDRRSIARELHDGTTQSLIALNTELVALEKTLREPDATVLKKVRYSKELVKQCLDEIRTVSYLLHPPLLDELGLDTALRGFVEGFSARSEIQVSLHLPPDLCGLSRDIQLAIFRVVQESLTNVHRHSGSRSASIHLTMTPDQLTLEIADQGRGRPAGMLPNVCAGVGINSMRARIRQLGGHCEIESSSRGTTVRAVLPITRPERRFEFAEADHRASAERGGGQLSHGTPHGEFCHSIRCAGGTHSHVHKRFPGLVRSRCSGSTSGLLQSLSTGFAKNLGRAALQPPKNHAPHGWACHD
jgi:signal transduction histidine kinase